MAGIEQSADLTQSLKTYLFCRSCCVSDDFILTSTSVLLKLSMYIRTNRIYNVPLPEYVSYTTTCCLYKSMSIGNELGETIVFPAVYTICSPVFPMPPPCTVFLTPIECTSDISPRFYTDWHKSKHIERSERNGYPPETKPLEEMIDGTLLCPSLHYVRTVCCNSTVSRFSNLGLSFRI